MDQNTRQPATSPDELRIVPITYKVFHGDQFIGVVSTWPGDRWWAQRAWVSEAAARETVGKRTGLRRLWPDRDEAADWLRRQYRILVGEG